MWALDELGEVNHVVSIVVQLFPDAIHLAIFFKIVDPLDVSTHSERISHFGMHEQTDLV